MKRKLLKSAISANVLTEPSHVLSKLEQSLEHNGIGAPVVRLQGMKIMEQPVNTVPILHLSAVKSSNALSSLTLLAAIL